MKCPVCKNEINIGKLIRSVNSEAQKKAARLNGKKGGRPKGKKLGKTQKAVKKKK